MLIAPSVYSASMYKGNSVIKRVQSVGVNSVNIFGLNLKNVINFLRSQ